MYLPFWILRTNDRCVRNVRSACKRYHLEVHSDDVILKFIFAKLMVRTSLRISCSTIGRDVTFLYFSRSMPAWTLFSIVIVMIELEHRFRSAQGLNLCSYTYMYVYKPQDPVITCVCITLIAWSHASIHKVSVLPYIVTLKHTLITTWGVSPYSTESHMNVHLQTLVTKKGPKAPHSNSLFKEDLCFPIRQNLTVQASLSGVWFVPVSLLLLQATGHLRPRENICSRHVSQRAANICN